LDLELTINTGWQLVDIVAEPVEVNAKQVNQSDNVHLFEVVSNHQSGKPRKGSLTAVLRSDSGITTRENLDVLLMP
jgi:hypothetical protein